MKITIKPSLFKVTTSIKLETLEDHNRLLSILNRYVSCAAEYSLEDDEFITNIRKKIECSVTLMDSLDKNPEQHSDTKRTAYYVSKITGCKTKIQIVNFQIVHPGELRFLSENGVWYEYSELVFRKGFYPTVKNNGICCCSSDRQTPLINGKHICSICNKPIY